MRVLRILLLGMVPVALWAVLVWVPACSENGSADQDGNGLNDGVSDGNPDGSGNADSPGDTNGADFLVCDEEVLDASPLSNLLLVVDKSASMNDPTAGSDPDRTKVMDLRDAVNFLLDEYDGKIRFGWMPFPNQDDCDPGVVSVDVGDDSASTIRMLVNAFVAWGKTPTGETLSNAAAYEGLQDLQRNNFVVLVTDGLPTCPNGGGQADSDLALAGVQQLKVQGIDTFVIGLGEDINSSNPQLLTDMALAGGTNNYHPASSLDQLKAAFEEIGKAIFDCNLSLEVVPETPDWIWVYFDGQPVSRDRNHQNGFDYNGILNQIDFYGPACDRLLNGEVSEIEVKMGCAPPD
ncbi:MAG: VWA domain-containing protein [Deltaproteobacteria bacterium]|nr:VWA domain-containing protein [Deltaproteobacteria bacterium]MBW1871019.1 VWA domain-containing protein [Deltaproteobacteria bacterium]